MPIFPHKLHTSPSELAHWLEAHVNSIQNIPCNQHNLFSQAGTNDFETQDLTINNVECDIKNILARSFNAFDKIFFNNTLHQQCEVKILDPKHADLGGDRGCTLNLKEFPETLSHREVSIVPVHPDGALCCIFIAEDPGDSCRPIIETLLHEMIHAFFIINSCRCSLNCEGQWQKQTGYTGHGIPWFNVALRVEEAMNHHFEGVWDLNRSASFALECLKDYSSPHAPRALVRALKLEERLVEQHIDIVLQDYYAN